jgi:hypothetical protein
LSTGFNVDFFFLGGEVEIEVEVVVAVAVVGVGMDSGWELSVTVFVVLVVIVAVAAAVAAATAFSITILTGRVAVSQRHLLFLKRALNLAKSSSRVAIFFRASKSIAEAN